MKLILFFFLRFCDINPSNAFELEKVFIDMRTNQNIYTTVPNVMTPKYKKIVKRSPKNHCHAFACKIMCDKQGFNLNFCNGGKCYCAFQATTQKPTTDISNNNETFTALFGPLFKNYTRLKKKNCYLTSCHAGCRKIGYDFGYCNKNNTCICHKRMKTISKPIVRELQKRTSERYIVRYTNGSTEENWRKFNIPALAVKDNHEKRPPKYCQITYCRFMCIGSGNDFGICQNRECHCVVDGLTEAKIALFAANISNVEDDKSTTCDVGNVTKDSDLEYFEWEPRPTKAVVWLFKRPHTSSTSMTKLITKATTVTSTSTKPYVNVSTILTSTELPFTELTFTELTSTELTSTELTSTELTSTELSSSQLTSTEPTQTEEVTAKLRKKLLYRYKYYM